MLIAYKALLLTRESRLTDPGVASFGCPVSLELCNKGLTPYFTSRGGL